MNLATIGKIVVFHGLIVVSASGLAEGSAVAADQQLAGSSRDAQRWDFFLREKEINRLWMDLSAVNYPSYFAIERVSLITMKDDSVTPKMTVVVKDGLIEKIGPSASTLIPSEATRVDGTGMYLLPGLTDMHVHNLVSNSQQLLNLANGVTSVRDMGGFNWMLAMRNRINDGTLLAPYMYITGHILSGIPMEFYATVVTTPEAARQSVRDQAAAGYDFIKVHNVMLPEVFAAINDEAANQGLDVVGHVSQGITVAEAVGAGLRTLEHFKGYILDSSLSLSDEDYVAATQGKDIWNTPTFYNYRAELRGDAARKTVLQTEEIQFVSPSDRLDWKQVADTTPDTLNELRSGVFELSKDIFVQLQSVDGQFLAGTDSGGGMAFTIPGFALHDELRIMQENGLTPFETLQTATTNAAAAMRRSSDFGTIEVGKRADLLMVSSNPLESIDNLRSIKSVVVRGRLLDQDAISCIFDSISDIYRLDSEGELKQMPTVGEVDNLINQIVLMRSNGFVFRDFHLGEISRLLQKAGFNDRAATVRSIKLR